MRQKAMRFERLEIAPAYQIVCDAIERQILSGKFAPGYKLPTETELAKQFGLTRHTVREGIRVLEQGGLVRREARRRLYVSLPHHAELAPRASRALLMQRVTFRDLWEVSCDLESTAARLAATRIAPEQIELLRANLAATEKALSEGSSIIKLDIEFHATIAEATSNRALLLAREPISLLFYPALTKLFTHEKTRVTGPRRLLEAHRRIVDGIDNRDAEASYEWMHKHMVDFRRGYDVCGLDIDAEVGFNTTSSIGDRSLS